MIKNYDDYIYTKNGCTYLALEVKPINFKLKSEGEQIAILESYKMMLKQCNCDFQIVVSSFKVDVSEHLKNIEKYSYGNEKLENMKKSYTALVSELVENKNSIERRFFIVLEQDKNTNENISKIMSGLEACGNEVVMCDKKTIESLLKNYFKRNVKDESN